MQIKDLIAITYAEHADEGILNRTSRKIAETESIQSVEKNGFLMNWFIKEDLSMSGLLLAG